MATFGHTGTEDGGYNIENYIIGGYFQMGATTGTADSITAELSCTEVAHDVKCALYDSSSNLVTNGVTEEKSISVGADQSITFNFVGTKPTVTANAYYYIVAWGGAALGLVTLHFDSTSGTDNIKYDAETYNGFPASASFSTVDDNTSLIICTYTVGGEALTHSTSDTMTISDSIATVSVMKHAKADTMTIGDAIGTVSVMKQALTDTMSISDALLVSQGFHVAFADTMNISDSLAAELIVAEVIRRMGIARKIGTPTAQNIGVGL